MEGDVEVADATSSVFDDEQDVENAQRGGRTVKKSIAESASLWFRRNASQRFSLSGSTGRRGVYRDTVD
jgi:hypothetical protein